METAVKLKQSGFPQFVGDYQGHAEEDPGAPEGEEPIIVYIPTLIELVEGLGDSFHAIERKSFPDLGIITWVAYSNVPNALGISAHVVQQGASPEEAVSTLWLAIHKQVN